MTDGVAFATDTRAGLDAVRVSPEDGELLERGWPRVAADVTAWLVAAGQPRVTEAVSS